MRRFGAESLPDDCGEDDHGTTKPRATVKIVAVELRSQLERRDAKAAMTKETATS
jgi:hypothetical protein